MFTAYRHRTTAPGVVAAEAALRACNYTPRRILSGGGSDANAFEANGLHCINLANGTERNHESSERVSQVALEGMLDVTFALLDELAESQARERGPPRGGGSAGRAESPRPAPLRLGERECALAQDAAQQLARSAGAAPRR